jgi:hypothetical protein
MRVIKVDGDIVSTMSSNSQNGEPAVVSLHPDVEDVWLRPKYT